MNTQRPLSFMRFVEGDFIIGPSVDDKIKTQDVRVLIIYNSYKKKKKKKVCLIIYFNKVCMYTLNKQLFTQCVFDRSILYTHKYKPIRNYFFLRQIQTIR